MESVTGTENIKMINKDMFMKEIGKMD